MPTAREENTQQRRGQGGFEYVLLLAGILLTVILTVVVLRGSVLSGVNQQISSSAGVYFQLVSACAAISQLVIHPNGTNATLTLCQPVDPNTTVIILYSTPLTFNGSQDGPGNMTFSNNNLVIFLNITGKNNGQNISTTETHSADVYVNNVPLLIRLPATVAFATTGGSGGAGPGPDTSPPTIISGPSVTVGITFGSVSFSASETSNMTLYSVAPGPSFTTLTHGLQAVHNGIYHNITGLSSSTQYFYNITLCDASSNCATYGPYNFTTLGSPQAPNVTLLWPLSGTSLPQGTRLFYYRPVDESGFTNATLYANFTGTFVANGSNTTSMMNNTENSLSVSPTLGYRTWNVQVCDTTNPPLCAFAPANNTIDVCATYPFGLVSLWTAEGTTEDYVGGNNGTLVNLAGYTEGKVGRAFNFVAGSAQYLQIPDSNSLDFSSQMTITMWIKPSTITNFYETLIAKRNGGTNYEIFLNTGGSRALGYFNGGIYLTAFVPPTGQWTHVALTVNQSANQAKLYANGVVQGTFATGLGATNAAPLNVGSFPGFSEHYNGAIDELQFYNRALSDAEVVTLNNTGLGGSGGLCSPSCGNGVLEAGEVCDGLDLASHTCTTLGAGTGSLGCSSDCRSYNFSTCSQTCSNFTTNLVSLWAAENNTEDSVSTNAGSFLGTIAYDTGRVGRAFSFSSSYVQVPDNSNLDMSSQLTVSMWIKPGTITNGYETLIAKRGGTTNYEVYLDTGSTRRLGYFNGANNPTAFVPPTGQWTHVVVTVNHATSRTKIYANGVLLNVFFTGLGGVNNDPLYIGSYPGGSEHYRGLLDEVHIYNRMLSDAEVVLLNNTGRTDAGGYCARACGNNLREAPEVCDGTDLGGQTCASLGFAGGTLGCSASCTTFNISSCSQQCVTPQSGLVSWWPGDSGSNARDIWDSNNGTFVNGATTTTGYVGQAFTFTSASGQHVNVPNAANLSLSGTATMAFWVKPSTITNYYETLIAKRNGGTNYEVYLDTGGTRRFCYYNGGNYCTTFVPSTGQWTHLAVTIDSGRTRFYVNGTITDLKLTGLGGINTGALYLGSYAPLSEHYNGVLDEVQIYNRALSPTELQTIYLASTAGLCRPA